MTAGTLDEFIARIPRPFTRIHSTTIQLAEPFLDMVRRFARLPGTIALMSGGNSDCARYHILGIDPLLTLKGSACSLSMQSASVCASFEGSPFDSLKHILTHFALPSAQYPDPLCAGLLGYLSYDLKDCLEVLPRTSIDDLHLPQLYLVAPSLLVVHDRLNEITKVYAPVSGESDVDAQGRIQEFAATLERPLPSVARAGVQRSGLKSGFSRQEYRHAVEAIRDYIVRGHVYQVNMSQRFEAGFDGDPFELFARLYGHNPAAFFAYVNAGDHQIISTSPERFVQLREGVVETRPIKGTRPRGANPEDDARLRAELEDSPKDDAELSMIVDLLRNDIGRVCRAGSVRVSQHKRLESYKNVHHLVSVVSGLLDDDKDAIDLICATFPGGSITGCPKIRAMEVIDELEPVRRHIYTGSIGYISFHGTMDLSIAIRTATVTNERMLFSVGGGVVYDSDSNDEYDETLHKGQTLIDALSTTEVDRDDSVPIAWCNGLFKPSSETNVSIENEGFLYGYGFFETIRVQGGRPMMLEEHLARFNQTWKVCFDSPIPDVTWHELIQQVVAKNGLDHQIAAVKILAAAGHPAPSKSAEVLLVTARKYVHRLESISRSGLRLCIYHHPRHSHLADHKTMNYMFYKLAGKWAKSQGADEAVVLNADGTVSETNSANLFCVTSGKLCRPVSKHVLPGTMEQAVCKLLATWKLPVESRELTVEDLKRADYVFLTNSLMGAVPVSHFEEIPMGDDAGLCRKINQALLG